MKRTPEAFGGLRSSYEQDAYLMLDGIDFDLAKMAGDEDAQKSQITTIFVPPSEDDKAELINAATAYARKERGMPRMRAAQRWRFAMRLRFAASLLEPLHKEFVGIKTAFFTKIASIPDDQLTEWLLTEGIWFACTTFNEAMFISERTVSAPARPPWMTPEIMQKEQAETDRR